ncbi:MAG: TonB-dependent receptor [Deltaproteobacteria bacterium]|nr:TonB-dependent receptor [Deltaproteobacteria bacterium]
MRHVAQRLLAVVFVLVLTRPALAQDADLDTASLAELLDENVEVAARRPTSARDSPGVITLLSRQEILASGARDLVDVLMLVPGFQFGVDVESVVGAGFRGLWGHEGKILLLFDGHEMNETMYGTLQFGSHFPVDLIKRVEIIRGPGSVMYGGNAELAVINVVLQESSDLDGAAALVSWGQRAEGWARGNASLSYGKKLGDLRITGSIFGGLGQRAGGDYVDANGSRFQMQGATSIEPLNARLSVAYRALELKVMVDRYGYSQRDGYDAIQEQATFVRFDSYLASLQYDLEVAELFHLTPRIEIKRQYPWNELIDQPAGSPSSDALGYNVIADRLTGKVQLRTEQVPRMSLIGGVEYSLDAAQVLEGTEPYYYFQSKPHEAGGDRDASRAYFTNLAAYAQAIADLWYVNLTAGARYENHSQFGSSFVPRLALTRAFGPFHFKALAAQAFRSPAIGNIELSPSLRSETTTTFELEVGYLIAQSVALNVNGFDTTISDPIVYRVDEATSQDDYLNLDKVGTRGLEAEVRVKASWGSVRLSYAFYQARSTLMRLSGDQAVEEYSVPGHGLYTLGFTPHKATLSASVRIWRGLSIAPSAILLGRRWAYTSTDADGNAVLEPLGTTVLLNAALSDRSESGLGVSLGVYNILGQRFAYSQPYQGGHAPLPGLEREFGLRLAYQPQHEAGEP